MIRLYWFLATLFTLITITANCQVDRSDWEGTYPDGCTSITVGKKASVDGSVITSHTDDSHRTRSDVQLVAPSNHQPNSTVTMYKRVAFDTLPMAQYKDIKVGIIPQVAHTYGYINSAYACLNEHQLGIGESTFGGREELISDKGLIDCQRLCILILERCTTAREAIRMSGKLLEEYGWNDAGECLTIADKKEVWHLEIVGPGKDKKGAIWAAQRVPDDHIAVNANASTIKEVNLADTLFFYASKNIFEIAKQKGWWNSDQPFIWCYAYAPESRTSLASRRREWRVFDLLAPSLKLDPNSENYPFSVKPDHKVSLNDLKKVFADYYEGTPFDMTKDLLVADDNGKMKISPLANPHMPYDMNKMLRINGGWGWRGERTIARWYTMYATLIQCRDWLPDEIGGVAWFALDNVATSIYIPIYGSVSDLPLSYKTDGRKTGFSKQSAWWAFNRLSTLTAQRWGDMRKDVDTVWNPLQTELFSIQPEIEKNALSLYNSGQKTKAKKLLQEHTFFWGNKVVEEAWKLGDLLWTKYDELF